jgi:hypothetical protein
MTTIWDKEYAATKVIKQGLTKLSPPFDELANWIASTCQVTVLNATYDVRDSIHAPRLLIIFEHESEKKKFHRGFNFDEKKQRDVQDKFVALVRNGNYTEYDIDGLFVVFSAFAPLAREEADDRLSDLDLKCLQAQIANPDLWEIHRCFGRVVFFFYTEEQVRRYVARGKKADYAKMYFAILKPHDEFGYLSENEFTVAFDSKENFEKNYGGSWFNYDR